MTIRIRQDLRLSQHLVMTPQLQQAIRLLQLSQLDLVGMVKKELQENPVLEERADTAPGQEDDPENEDLDEIRRDVEKVEFEEYLRDNDEDRQPIRRGDAEIPSYENNLAKKTSLAEHLLWQLRLSGLSLREEEIGAVIIGNINDDGYLTSSVEDLCRATGASEKEVTQVLRRIQEFDPPGIASRDLQECLLIQARQWGSEFPLIDRVIREHLKALEYHQYPEIARALTVPLERILKVAQLISRMEPKPGRLFVSEDSVYIIPDVYVYKSGDGYAIQLNEDGMPKLKISQIYRRLLKEGSQRCEDTKRYIEDKIRSAIWFIRSIHQRQRTLYKVTKSIVRFQREFLEYGLEYLKPMILRDVAEDIGVHESTISRVTTNKYVHTPRGLFELKFFFNSGVHKSFGENIASVSIKDKVKQLIEAEEPENPLSDQQIVEILEKEDITIARRTVSKYREMLGIASANKRKRSYQTS